MTKQKIFVVLIVAVFVISPTFTFAAPHAGVKPGNLFYFFDTTLEKIGLFFTFNSEKKAHKALEYADERLAEIESVSEDNNSDGVKTALVNYENNMALAAENSKEVVNKEKAEILLTSIADNTSRNQEVLSAVLLKVPESAKEAIAQAIEASKKGQEEAVKQLAELKGEIAELKKEVAELKKEKETKEAAPRADEVERLKREVNELKQRQSVPVVKSSPEPKKPEPPVINSAPEQKPEAKTKTTTLPNGAVVELDARGDVVRTIKEAPAKTAEDIVGDLSSQIDILKKQNAEAERQRAAQQKILEEQQKTLEKIKENTTPQNTTPIPTPVLTPTSIQPAPKTYQVNISPISYSKPLTVTELKNGIAIFTSNISPLFEPKIAVEFFMPQDTLFWVATTSAQTSLLDAEKREIPFRKILIQSEILFSTEIIGNAPKIFLRITPTNGDYYQLPMYQIKITIKEIANRLECTSEYKDGCIFPTFPISNTITINPSF